jgi:hypothetical protein
MGMKELLRTNDLVLISRLEALFADNGLHVFVADAHMSAVEGSVGFLPRRIMVVDDEIGEARALLADVGLAEFLPDA